ncbi:MAG: DUF2225 domain-containing protein [Fibrobacter sp.]|nr:DUF2225 domain-containing protein [Fibrobacter sp.]
MTVDVTEVKRRLNLFLNDPDLVDEYIERYGPLIDMKKIREMKDVRDARLKKLNPMDTGDDPLFQIMVKCPVCYKDQIPCYELKAKSQQITLNKFLVPLYEGAGGFRSCDFSYITVTVCPQCLFASPDKKDFSRKSSANNSWIKGQLSGNLISALKEKTEERKEIIKNVNDYADYFKHPRLDNSAIASYRLAMARAKVEAWHEQPYAFYKLGSYALRIAYIMKEVHQDNTKVLIEALSYFEEAFKTSNCPQEEIEMQVIYLIVALNLKLGDFKKANSYIGVFSSLHSTRVAEMKDNPKLNTVHIDKWSDKAKYLWEDREISDLFENE